MGLDREDRNWLDTKFTEVHTRITHSEKELTDKIVNVRDYAREQVEKHEAKKHNPAKTLGILGGLAGLGAAAWEGLKALVSHAKGNP